MAVQVLELKTDVPELVREAMDGFYGRDYPVTYTGGAESFVCELRLVSAGDLGADHFRSRTHSHCKLHMVDTFMGLYVHRGVYDRYTAGGTELRPRRGDVICVPLDTVTAADFRDVDVSLLRVSREVLARIAGERLHPGRGPLRFTGVTPISTAGGRAWRALISYVHREVAEEDSTVANLLIEAQLAELIAATALTTFANNAINGDLGWRHGPATPVSVRRAKAYIETNADQAITITEIAHAAGVTPRALQYGFARHHDTTPTAYLRQVRLQRAHHELLAADPASGTTVHQIARAWGFANPSRFSAVYRAMFGQSPGDTLRS